MDSDGVVMGEAGSEELSACAIRMLRRVNIFAVGIVAMERAVSVNWDDRTPCSTCQVGCISRRSAVVEVF